MNHNEAVLLSFPFRRILVQLCSPNTLLAACVFIFSYNPGGLQLTWECEFVIVGWVGDHIVCSPIGSWGAELGGHSGEGRPQLHSESCFNLTAFNLF